VAGATACVASPTLYENGAAQTACLLKGSRKTGPVKIPADVPYMGHPQTALGALIDLTAKITATEPEPATGQ
jgi:hypothetical protein